MKIGINLVGVSGDSSLTYHSPNLTAPGPKGRDWSLQKECVMSQMVNCWDGHEVSLYLTTYNHSDINNMISFYKPKKVKVLDYYHSNMQLTYIDSLRQLIGEDLDFIVSVRPDLFPYKKLSSYPIQFNKFNFFHKQNSLWQNDVEFADYPTALQRWKIHIFPTYHLVNDTLFMLPMNMLNIFIEAIENLHNDTHMPGKEYATMHNIWIHLRKFLNPDQIHFLIPGIHAFVNTNIQEAFVDFGSLNYEQKEYFLCREADDNIESWNKGQDWKKFVTMMKQRLNVV